MVFMECLSYEFEDIIISSFKSRSHHRDGTFGTFAVPRKTEKFLSSYSGINHQSFTVLVSASL